MAEIIDEYPLWMEVAIQNRSLMTECDGLRETCRHSELLLQRRVLLLDPLDERGLACCRCHDECAWPCTEYGGSDLEQRLDSRVFQSGHRFRFDSNSSDVVVVQFRRQDSKDDAFA